MSKIDPFIRWAGGKTWLLPYLQQIIGDTIIEHYHEPFLGGGAVFFSLEHNKKAYLSDANPELINTYIQVRDNPKDVLEYLSTFKNTKEDYYRIRDHYQAQYPEEEAARFIYLNQTSFNGLYRVNRQGKYNVPYGFRKNWTYECNRIIEASKKLHNTNIVSGDFEVNKYRIKENDLVFLDPPYTVSHNHNGFIEYNKNLFSIEDQKRLNTFINYIKQKGAYYILTNAAHEAIFQIFDKEEDRTIELPRKSLIGGKNSKRAEITEYIFTNLKGGVFDGQ
jgi:DNA adenine methylase